MKTLYPILLLFALFFSFCATAQNNIKRGPVSYATAKYKIIHIDTVKQYYNIGKYGEPGYMLCDSVQIWAHIIMVNFPMKFSSGKPREKIAQIMKEHHLSNVMVFRNEASSMLSGLNSQYAARLVQQSHGILGRYSDKGWSDY